ncbi:ArsR/SmtB family transcription factor [Brevibacillus sp. 179-C9.3 HS]|uniref:ArsR/SmtB family transcription factor n=1 Tax=unclassified Brevibacillus TaxID=2684853 RepID=UPI0039A1E562
MKVLNIGSERTTYRVEISYSPLFEAALGIAAATYDQLHHTMEHPSVYWRQLLDELAPSVRREVDYAKEHNTWKTLLQLLDLYPFADLDSFLSYVRELSTEQLRYEALPFLGEHLQEARRNAARGSEADLAIMQEACRSHLFFESYIAHIASVNAEELRGHILLLMEGWYTTHIRPREGEIVRMLERDWSQKQSKLGKLSSEALVEYATGTSYLPEPAVTRVLLIPQAIYRPWTVQADAVGTKIFYYPVADENLRDVADPYQPPPSLVQALKALGDEHRLRMVKMLAEKDLSLQEMTDHLSMAKSTVHHHLSMLRSAHLVETVGSRYRLRRRTLDKLPLLWDEFLDRSTP